MNNGNIKEEVVYYCATSDANEDPYYTSNDHIIPTTISIRDRTGIFSRITTKTHAASALGLGILAFIILMVFSGLIVIMVMVLKDSVVGLVLVSIASVILLIFFICAVIGTIQQIRDYNELKKRNVIGIQIFTTREVEETASPTYGNDIQDLYVDDSSPNTENKNENVNENSTPTPMTQAYLPPKHFFPVQPCPIRPNSYRRPPPGFRPPAIRPTPMKGLRPHSPHGFRPAPGIIPQPNATIGYPRPYYMPHQRPRPMTPFCNNPPPSHIETGEEEEENPYNKLDDINNENETQQNTTEGATEETKAETTEHSQPNPTENNIDSNAVATETTETSN